MSNTNDKCPTCGGLCHISWSGLDLVENTGDETLATKHYTSIPSFEETQYDQLKEENETLKKQVEVLREALKPLAHLDLTGVRGEIVYQRDNTKITVSDVTTANEVLKFYSKIGG